METIIHDNSSISSSSNNSINSINRSANNSISINSINRSANNSSKYHKNKSYNNIFKDYKPNYCVNKNIVIDIAVLCQEYAQVDTSCENHVINLDDIVISKHLFKSLFYPHGENFGIDKNFINQNSVIFLPLISFLPEYRTVNGHKFYLLEQIFSNIEHDLNISRDCFTVDSRVEITNEIISITSLCDINTCSVLSSLTWTNILEIINNYRIVEHDKKDNSINNIIPICSISIIFKTPTAGVNNTVIRFNYKIKDI